MLPAQLWTGNIWITWVRVCPSVHALNDPLRVTNPWPLNSTNLHPVGLNLCSEHPVDFWNRLSREWIKGAAPHILRFLLFECLCFPAITLFYFAAFITCGKSSASPWQPSIRVTPTLHAAYSDVIVDCPSVYTRLRLHVRMWLRVRQRVGSVFFCIFPSAVSVEIFCVYFKQIVSQIRLSDLQ